MEVAKRFSFIDDDELSAVIKFDPTDEELVEHYLLPRAAGVRTAAYEHAVIDDDPYSCPPWELLRRHGHGDSDQAFFFFYGAGPLDDDDMAQNAAVAGGVGGVWRRQQRSVDRELVIGGAPLTFRRYALTYYRDGDRRPSGWEMHEYRYHAVHPVLHPAGAVVARISISERAKKMRKRMRKLRQEAAAADAAARAAQAAVAPPGPDQPGPSNYFVLSEFHSDDCDCHAAAGVASVVGEGRSSGGGAHHQSLKD